MTSFLAEWYEQRQDMEEVFNGTDHSNELSTVSVRFGDNFKNDLNTHCLGQFFPENTNDIETDEPAFFGIEMTVQIEEEVIFNVEDNPTEPVPEPEPMVDVPVEPQTDAEHQSGSSSEGTVVETKRKRGRPAYDKVKRAKIRRMRERKASQIYRRKKKTANKEVDIQLEAENERNRELINKLETIKGLFPFFNQYITENWNAFDSNPREQIDQSLNKINNQINS